MNPLTPEAILRMSYNELIGVVRETNRPPGGRTSILEILSRCFLSMHCRVLDVGTSTGTTAIEIARVLGCEVIGADVNDDSLEEARHRANVLGLRNLRFVNANVMSLPFDDEYFDLVFCGNLFSLVDQKKKAFDECRRVVRTGGYIAAIPMYYIDTPPDALVEEVRHAIQVDIPVNYKDDVCNFYATNHLELYSGADFRFDHIPENVVVSFCNELLARPHLKELSLDAHSTLQAQYRKFMLLFRDNLSYMGFSILILRKTNFIEDRELFTATRIR